MSEKPTDFLDSNPKIRRMDRILKHQLHSRKADNQASDFRVSIRTQMPQNGFSTLRQSISLTQKWCPDSKVKDRALNYFPEATVASGEVTVTSGKAKSQLRQLL
ncbi:hypothetical protein MTR67_046119 [Solanum verrucosum]|uniref:Uncharacterized protein n=3 Tax=Solanum verrucosum TaxID=315347 RepID=A0AAF0UVX5_SOLVR|nr:hypothetical protein MTR67_036583 [Solanum verrucosum]WMV52734.1 hypothetical protein MTR67_046119 [Solanum verrucosum]